MFSFQFFSDFQTAHSLFRWGNEAKWSAEFHCNSPGASIGWFGLRSWSLQRTTRWSELLQASGLFYARSHLYQASFCFILLDFAWDGQAGGTWSSESGKCMQKSFVVHVLEKVRKKAQCPTLTNIGFSIGFDVHKNEKTTHWKLLGLLQQTDWCQMYLQLRPEGERPILEGNAALRFLDALFGQMGATGAGGILAFRGSFFLLYELYTSTLEVKLFPDDQSNLLASALLRLMCGAEGFSMNSETAVLRALDSTPELCSEMPLWGSAATKRTWQAGWTRLC